MSDLVAGPRERARARVVRLQRQMVDSDHPAFVFLVLLTAGLVAGGLLSPDVVPQTAMFLPIVLASLWLGPRTLPWLVGLCLIGVLVLTLALPEITLVTVVRVLITFAIALLIMVTSFRRTKLGVAGPRGESMFVDLRDRIANQGTIPGLPSGWHVESASRSAGGTSFGGDFIVASKATDGSTLDLIVVDVSGKGIEAGTRSLLLSGAFGGLASAVAPERFLCEANEYLLRQEWQEGFATAIHLHLSLRTGDFELRKAGHPPAVWLHAGSGRWSVLDSDGPVLGLIPDSAFEVVRGRLMPDDALLMYTDGLVETVSRDIASGIDKLAGRGQLLFPSGYQRGARKLIDELASSNDDGALVLVHRRSSHLAH
ncbi:serine/threonine-protein phosphatase [Nocardioides marmoriginsengisoli]|uniref:Serine/threonine-protein phosphatase n=1 Tax=Nocardioides marmoriginsengisoli TaxID=661483 RepID=A0A3N0CJK1_9ACTN|nr:PP2C family protein-serine/threonine phosphatase [Nocardioides marmoriginsengisoli]RNL63196.1 serine/threonine-protein phosphatase [Nocardioides marmoriginsengisoli]